MRHAWLIIAHNEFGILQELVRSLDGLDMDFFIHIDRKVRELPDITVKQGRLFFLQDRVDVRWGSITQIKCELALLKAACKEGGHDFYHIISGTTLPLVECDGIRDYFSRHQGECILSGLGKDLPYQETLKMKRFNLFLRNYARKDIRGRISQFLWKSFIAFQRISGIERNRDVDFYKASNWLSLTQEAVNYLLYREEKIFKTFRYSFCGDEYFVPTTLMASPLKEKLVNDDHYLKCTIARSTSDVFHLTEYPELCNSGYLFARKFSSK